MSDLKQYLVQKRAALLERRAAIQAGEIGPHALYAHASAEGRSGIRRIRIRDFQILSDSTPAFAGYDLGPGSPEILLGSLASCLTHTWLIHAADQELPLESLEVETTAVMDPRNGGPGFEETPVHPHAFAYRVTIVSCATPEAVAAVDAAVRKFCPVLNLFARATEVSGALIHNPPGLSASFAA